MGGVDLGRSVVQPPAQSRVSPGVGPGAQRIVQLGLETPKHRDGKNVSGKPAPAPDCPHGRRQTLVSRLNSLVLADAVLLVFGAGRAWASLAGSPGPANSLEGAPAPSPRAQEEPHEELGPAAADPSAAGQGRDWSPAGASAPRRGGPAAPRPLQRTGGHAAGSTRVPHKLAKPGPG